MATKQPTRIESLGEFGLIDRLISGIEAHDPTTLTGAGDDAAVIDCGNGRVMVVSTDMLVEGIDFDLTYFPLKHLGYKVVTRGISDIIAMNARPSQILLSLGVSSKISVEALEELYEGARAACDRFGIDIAGGDTTASMNGLVINITALGQAERDRLVYRSGASQHDLICISGNMGAAYMGAASARTREARAERHDNPEPQFEGLRISARKVSQPQPRIDIVEALAEEGIRPTSMIDLSDGLASDLLQLCRASDCGVRIYLDRIPIAQQTNRLAEEMHLDPVMAALNGGEDYELLFTVPLSMQEQVMRLGLVDVIGHITPESTGCFLVTPDGQDIRLKAQGFPEQRNEK